MTDTPGFRRKPTDGDAMALVEKAQTKARRIESEAREAERKLAQRAAELAFLDKQRKTNGLSAELDDAVEIVLADRDRLVELHATKIRSLAEARQERDEAVSGLSGGAGTYPTRPIDAA